METFGVTELVGAAFGVLYVALAIKQNAWCWPVGVVNAALFVVVFAQARLYAASALQGVYLALSLYGWYAWSRGAGAERPLAVSRTPRGAALVLGGAAVVATAVLGVALKQRTDAALPFADAATTTASLAAQWMTTRKWLENWLVWVVVDAAYVAMALSQRLYATAVLYALFLVMAGIGDREWRAALAAAVESGE